MLSVYVDASEQLAGWRVGVPVAECLIDLVHSDLLRSQLVRIDLHVDRILLGAEHIDL